MAWTMGKASGLPAPNWHGGVRVFLAAAGSFWVATLLHLPQAYWAVITALVVVQGTLGATVEAGGGRLMGTLLGVGLGMAAAAARHWQVPEPVLLTAVLAPAALIAATRRGFRTAPLAAIIVMTTGPAGSPLATAGLRVAEIGLGILVGLAVSALVLPEHANQACTRIGGEIRAGLAELARRLLSDAPPPPDELTERFAALRLRLRELVVKSREARREPRRGSPDPSELAQELRKLIEDLRFIAQARHVLGEVDGETAALLQEIGRAAGEAIAAGSGLALDAPMTSLRTAAKARSAPMLFVLGVLRRDLG